jgi:hypothetical protein
VTKTIEECVGKSYEERLETILSSTLESRRTKDDLMEVFKALRGFEGNGKKLFFKRHAPSTKGHSMQSNIQCSTALSPSSELVSRINEVYHNCIL